MPFTSPQLICFSYHKSGTSLFLHVMTRISEKLGLSLKNHYGMVGEVDPGPDIVLLPHSLLRGPIVRPYRAIRLVRDPRDIWVSGYLYHLRCEEIWCTNADLDPTPPIGWPQVDYSVIHRPEGWKHQYLERLGGRSYRQNLRDRPLADGLDFELAGYTGWTLATMREWTLNGADALDVKLEDVMADFDGTMLRIFDHFGFTGAQSQAALEVAQTEDVRRMDDSAMAQRPQIHSRTISKWPEMLSPEQIAAFEADHGDLIRALGYKLAGGSSVLDQGGEVVAMSGNRAKAPRPVETTQDPGIQLAVDDIPVRPTVTSQGTYRFAVAAEARRVVLRSRSNGPFDQGETRNLGLRVSEIAIRTKTVEVVIAADDPRLTSGWHNAEHTAGALWRWTDGAGELPWEGIDGPALVTIRCTALSEYPVHEVRSSKGLA